MTDEEAAQTAEMVNKIHSIPDEKLPEVLNDLSLGNISGGNVYDENDNEAIMEAIESARYKERYGMTYKQSMDLALITGGSVLGGIAVAGLLTVFTGFMCKMGATGNYALAVYHSEHGRTEEAAQCYAKAKNLSWMFPNDKAYFDSKLKALPK